MLAFFPQAVPIATGPGQQPSTVLQSGRDSGPEADNPRILVTIVQSRSTNSRGFRVVIYRDGSATATINGAGFVTHADEPRAQSYPAGSVEVNKLGSLLEKIGDVSRIPTGHCAKSVSFGTTTTIMYAGKTSGDLQCLREMSPGGDSSSFGNAQELKQFVQTTLAELKINDRRIAPNP